SALFTIFRVATHSLYRKAVRKHRARASVPPGGVSTFTFIARPGFPPKHSRARSTPWSVFQDGSFKAITPASQARAGFLGPTGRSRREAITRPGATTFPPPVSAPRNRCWPVGPESAPSRSKAEFRPTRLTSSVSLSTISRTVLLSFQSAFHLSLTVLVRYRSLANI